MQIVPGCKVRTKFRSVACVCPDILPVKAEAEVVPAWIVSLSDEIKPGNSKNDVVNRCSCDVTDGIDTAEERHGDVGRGRVVKKLEQFRNDGKPKFDDGAESRIGTL